MMPKVSALPVKTKTRNIPTLPGTYSKICKGRNEQACLGMKPLCNWSVNKMRQRTRKTCY